MGRKTSQKHSKVLKGGISPNERSASSGNGPSIPQSSFRDKLSSKKIAPNSTVSQFTVVDQTWAPSTYTAFKALLSSCLCAAIWSNISDCDETFNYWEPTHFLIYQSGLQTWEYSPVYAIRSYAYLLIHAIPGWLYSSLLQANKVLVFYFIRCLLAFACAGCETYLYKGVNSRFGSSVARLMLVFLLFAPGMFISGAAYLPSSFSMYFTMLATAAWLLRNYPIAIICVAISTFVGWPFAGILGIFIGLDMITIQKNVIQFTKWSVLAIFIILAPVVQIDSLYFGKLVVAPLNIVLYNIFSPYGPELYGTEAWTFYFMNGFLNFNFVFIVALLIGPILLLSQFVLPCSGKDEIITSWLAVAPMYIWFLIFFTTPHKEERFLYPVYPLICMSGAMCIHHIEKLLAAVIGKKWKCNVSIIGMLFVIVFGTMSVSRNLALYRGYHAPFDVYMEINRMVQESKIQPSNFAINLCVGKEWYRYPSSFFLPPNWHLQFIQSEFRGQLPKPYSSLANATAVIPKHMNDRNQEEPSRYRKLIAMPAVQKISEYSILLNERYICKIYFYPCGMIRFQVDIKLCHYLVDTNIPEGKPREPRYSANKDDWDVIFSILFLDSTRSPSLFRAFYIPWLTEEKCAYVDYNLLKSKHLKQKRIT